MSDPSPSSKSWIKQLTKAFFKKPRNRKELLLQLDEAKAQALLDQDAFLMIKGVLNVAEMQVRDIMIPRAQMVVIQHDATPSAIMPIIIQSAHSRFPVIGPDGETVSGILLAKDLLQYKTNGQFEDILVQDIIRPAVFIPESKRLNVLLKEFRLKRNHMAIVVDEYGGISGLITIEDVLEQIVGSIEDETDIQDKTTSAIKRMGDHEYTVKALTPIKAFNRYFNTNISDDAFDTIGGYVIQQFGHLPKQGESVEINDHFMVTILSASSRRIRLLQIKIHTHEDKKNIKDNS